MFKFHIGFGGILPVDVSL